MGLKIDKFGFPDTWFSKIFGKPVLLLLLIIGAIAFFITSLNRYVYIDDAFFGEQAYWLAKSGVVKIPSMIDFLGCDVQLFSYHKLNIFVGALLFKLFGWGITPLRITTLLFFAGLLYFIYRYYKSEYPELTTKHLWIAVFILVFNPQTYYLVYTFRPEWWVTFFGFASYYYLTRYYKENRNIFIVISGLFAGFAFLTHLNGLIFPVAGFIVLLLQRKYKAVLLFSVAATFIGSFYLWDLLEGSNFSTWLYQLKNWPDNNSPNYFKGDLLTFLKGVLIKLSQEHQRFFWSFKVWAISCFFIVSLVFNFRYFLNHYRILLIYLLTLIITQNFAGSQIAERYLLYYYPFFAIVISIGVVRLFNEKANIRKVLYIVMLILQIGCVSKMFIFISSENKYTIQSYDEILKKIPDEQARVLVPYEMFYNGLDKYNLISYKGFEYYQVRIKRKLSQEELFERASSFNIKYIVIPERVLDSTDTSVACLAGGVITENTYYQEYYRDEKAVILKRIQEN